jgi:heterodisulfide reductase subunit A-like polyferredoxin
MPVNSWEIEAAEKEGIKVQILTAPVEVVKEEGRISGVRCVKMKLGEPDASGRRRPIPIKGSEFVVPADMMIASVAQAPEISFLDETHGLEVTPRGTFLVDPHTLATNRPGVFAGGDVARGPWILIQAIADGRRGALSIDRYLRGVDLLTPRERITLPVADFSKEEMNQMVKEGNVDLTPRIKVPEIPEKERIRDFREVELVLTEAQAKREAERCLACGICSECHLCVQVCKREAIDHQQIDEVEELEVGSIILSPGYSLYRPELSHELGYGRFANVVTSMELERMLSASGPSGGQVSRRSDHRQPKKIAFLQCVGSRQKEYDYCSSVCCMYATKEALLAKEHAGGSLECDIFFMDLRAFSKGFEEYYERAKQLGVNYIRCRPASVEEVPDSKNLIIKYLVEDDKKVSGEYDMVVLSVGMRPPHEADHISSRFGIELNEHHFCKTSPFQPSETTREGIFVAGPFAEPKDIPETVMQASGAASKVLSLLKEVRGSLIVEKEFPPEREVASEDPRIGVFVCHCGSNIAGIVNVPEVVEYIKTLPNVVYTENNLYTCSNDAQEKIKERIKEHNLNRVVVASCTPRTHEPLFRNTIREAGLNPYLFEMANIRDQCSWVHMHEHEKATHKSKDLVRMAIAKSRLLEPLETRSVPVTKSALVIGAGIAGMTSALDLANQGYEVYLLEREKEIGGTVRHIHYLIDGMKLQNEIRSLVNQAKEHDRIHLFTQARIENIEGSVGNFKTKIAADGTSKELEHGTVIVATGAREYQPKEYLYGEDERVLTQLELEHRLVAIDGFFRSPGKGPRTVVMIQCVGSRDEERPYCSRLCCNEAVKNALKTKELSPATNVYVLYRDVRTYGFRESYYTKARQKGVVFIRYDKDEKPKVSKKGEGLEVHVYDQTLGVPMSIPADLVVLSTGIVPNEDSKTIAQFLKIPLNKDGFFLEAHMKLRPIDFATDGVFLAGMAHFPKTLEESVVQAQAASARAATVLSKDRIELEGNISQVVDENCDGCAYCVDTCPYKAITLIEYMREGAIKKTVETNEAVCKGCGSCMATCPKKGIFVRGFKLEQISAQVNAALGVEG